MTTNMRLNEQHASVVRGDALRILQEHARFQSGPPWHGNPVWCPFDLREFAVEQLLFYHSQTVVSDKQDVD